MRGPISFLVNEGIMRSMSVRGVVAVVCGVCLMVISGCSGSGLVPITGTVMVDGSPAEGAVLLFHPTDDPRGTVATGVVEADGRYKLVSNMREGVAPGKYKVSISWPDPKVQPTESQKMMGTVEPGPDLLKGKYATRESTTLTAEITGSTKEIPPFDLSTK
jgi:hypothetical protein